LGPEEKLYEQKKSEQCQSQKETNWGRGGVGGRKAEGGGGGQINNEGSEFGEGRGG